MYNEDEVAAALSFRKHKAAWDKVMEDESDLLTTIKFTTYKREFKKSSTRKYRESFLNTLAKNGINYWEAGTTDDGRWHFMLPEIEDGEADAD